MAYGRAEHRFHSYEDAKKMGQLEVNLKRRHFPDIEFNCWQKEEKK